MITAAAYAADTGRLQEPLRHLEALDAAWRALSLEFTRMTTAARDRQEAGAVAGDAIAGLVTLDQQLTVVESRAIEALEELCALIKSIGDA